MKKPKLQKSLFLIIRGDRPINHKAPYHPIILCTRYHSMLWESRGTREGHTVLSCCVPDVKGSSWALLRYKGFIIDGLNETQSIVLFDGVKANDAVKKLLENIPNAIWFSYDKMPEWIKDMGVKYPDDDFTRRRIEDDPGTCLTMSCQKENDFKLSREDYFLPWEINLS